tara:strand:- start:309 stop:1238 length:930 start_codon:yes stop_codon:yes gene_type:complete
MENILIIGSEGQLGSELEDYLVSLYGRKNIYSSDIKKNNSNSENFIVLDALDKDDIYKTIKENNIKIVYHLAAILSAKGEDNPLKTWNLNMNTLFNILELAKEKLLSKVFWPSSIAVFGPSSPKNPAPQFSIMDPTTVYGISKLAGERWCEYYNKNYSTDIRSIRFPGIISYKSLPGGGTTDYAVDIFHSAMKDEKYSCFLKEDTYLPMLYIDDALMAMNKIMEEKKSNLSIASSYNLSAMSFSPKELFESIKKHKKNFEIEYNHDYRQKIADTWPQRIDDSHARNDWGWKENFNLDKMTKEIILNLNK